MKNSKQRRNTVSSLRILASILLLSGTIRITNQGNVAFAQDAAPADQPSISDEHTILSVPFGDDAIETILAALKSREARLLEREQQLDDLDDTLRDAEARVTEKIAELTEIEAKLAATLALADSAAENDLARLATVYENMKPRDTAALFSEMDPGFAAGFLSLMQPDAAASVMTELEPQVAHTISVMLAGRNANAFNVQ
ncbi:flagellar motility protein MotE (MotC chaperone) [Loktanella ponticola]|uniref:Flagellar motility protein MotE (MotC chaperone) n=1 Tax=Yoonia ponticola TaxID=1524255 RepID=A0A7W9BHA4_9RHOB|nr:hypothetical protein [Yoonia ponticola]MBB5720425.1 flagellar motility protein MotE (MotC chaperone) [Yoonia ponticola]